MCTLTASSGSACTSRATASAVAGSGPSARTCRRARPSRPRGAGRSRRARPGPRAPPRRSACRPTRTRPTPSRTRPPRGPPCPVRMIVRRGSPRRRRRPRPARCWSPGRPSRRRRRAQPAAGDVRVMMSDVSWSAANAAAPENSGHAARPQAPSTRRARTPPGARSATRGARPSALRSRRDGPRRRAADWLDGRRPAVALRRPARPARPRRPRESSSSSPQRVLRRRPFHRQKLHLVLSGMRHLAAELGDRARYLRTDTYREALEQVGRPVLVHEPTSHAAADLVERLRKDGLVAEILPTPTFALSRKEFTDWAGDRTTLPDGGLLPRPTASLRRADGRARPAGRQVEPRPRQPRAPAPRRDHARTCPGRGSRKKTTSTPRCAPTSIG